MKLLATAAIAAGLLSAQAFAEAPCPKGGETPLAGTVRDSTLALIPGAALVLDGNRTATSGADGRFRFPCVGGGAHHLSANASGFSPNELTVTVPHAGELQMVLEAGSVQTNVEVNADEQAIEDPQRQRSHADDLRQATAIARG